MRFDPRSIGSRIAIDANVLFFWLDKRPGKHQRVCEEFVKFMLQQGKTIVIPTPIVAEYTRKQPGPFPIVRGIEFATFDRSAAETLGVKLPHAKLKEAITDDETRHYFEYDAMILACAIQDGCDVFVTTNTKDFRTAAQGQIRIEYLPSLDLDLMTPSLALEHSKPPGKSNKSTTK